jgi:hypothetical protein
MKKTLSLALLIFFGAFGCPTSPDPNTQAVKETILRYNQLLAEGYANMNMNPLQEVATADQAGKEYRHMAALGEAKIRMESTLKSIEFTGMTFSGRDEAAVITRETWDYTHIDTGTRAPVKVQKNVSYSLKYTLKKEQVRWLVISVEAVDEK